MIVLLREAGRSEPDNSELLRWEIITISVPASMPPPKERNSVLR